MKGKKPPKNYDSQAFPLFQHLDIIQWKACRHSSKKANMYAASDKTSGYIFSQKLHQSEELSFKQFPKHKVLTSILSCDCEIIKTKKLSSNEGKFHHSHQKSLLLVKPSQS